jgi:cardiolipin synthase C
MWLLARDAPPLVDHPFTEAMTRRRTRCPLRVWRFALVAVVSLAAACRSLPPRIPLANEDAPPAAHYGALADVAGRIRARLGHGESAHWLLDRSSLALDARLALIDEAAVSLDVQYFIWQEDATGHLLASRLLAAADRGVKVRLLVDDFGVSSERGDVLRLDAHPGIEIRAFNPWANRHSRLGTAVEFLARFRALNRRMHNKTMIADGQFAMVGGRNIGDRYFGLFEPFVQDDLDVLLAGAVVGDVARSFDAFWNSDLTFPVAWFTRDERPTHPLASTRVELQAAVGAHADVLREFPAATQDWSDYLERLTGTFSAGPTTLLWDRPDAGGERLYPSFKELVAGARREVLISSPYFIPDAGFRTLLRDLARRGVRVALVTNSLASNNHVVAHTGYRRWRRELLAAGVELYEMRLDAAALADYRTPPASPSALGLHSKAVVVDGERAFIGSPNVDPRSMGLNTEIGIVADSPELAARLRALLVRDMAPENAWRVTMDGEGWLEWTNGDETLRRQPAKGFGQRAIEFLLNLVPLKKQA